MIRLSNMSCWIKIIISQRVGDLQKLMFSIVFFKSGEFVVIKADLIEEYPPLWRIDGKTLLQKYEPFTSNGKVLYRNISTVSWENERIKWRFSFNCSVFLVFRLGDPESTHLPASASKVFNAGGGRNDSRIFERWNGRWRQVIDCWFLAGDVILKELLFSVNTSKNPWKKPNITTKISKFTFRLWFHSH